MRHDDILMALKAAEPALRKRGVTHAALFGSVARDEAGPESDIGIMVELDHEVVRTIYDYAGLKSYIADMFGGSVDVVDGQGLKPHVRPSATAEAVYAF